MNQVPERQCKEHGCLRFHKAHGWCELHYQRAWRLSKPALRAPEIEPVDPTEEWRPVPGFEDLYSVSSFGRVASVRRRGTKGGLIAINNNVDGYPAVTLVQYAKGSHHTVHALIAAAFIGPRPPGMEVRHLDGDRMHCVLSNLAYGTRSENNRDRRRHGTDHNVNKTHCPQGHEYTEANTIMHRGSRHCRTCNQNLDLNRRRLRWLAIDLLCDRGAAALEIEDSELRGMLIKNMEMPTDRLESALEKLKQLLATARVVVTWA